MQIIISLGILAPIIILGALSRKFNIISKNNAKALSFFVYYFALPALFVTKIAYIDLASVNLQILYGSIVPILFLLIILFLLKLIKVISKQNFVLLALSIVFSSNAFFGIPFFEAYAGSAGLNFAVVTSSFLGPVGIVLSIMLFEYVNKKEKGSAYIKKIIFNPLFLSVIAGIIFSLLNFRENLLVDSLDMLGKSAGPVAIFTLGIFIYDNFSVKIIKTSFVYAAFRIVFLPLAALLTVYFFNIGGDTKDYLVLQAGVPAAISLAVFAQRYEYKIGAISGIIIITSVFSFISLNIISIINNLF